jgi:hypothetical protein
MAQQIQTTTPSVFQLPAMIAIPQIRGGNQLNTRSMIQNPFRYIQGNTMENGAHAPIVTPILQVTPSSPASIAMNITNPT